MLQSAIGCTTMIRNTLQRKLNTQLFFNLLCSGTVSSGCYSRAHSWSLVETQCLCSTTGTSLTRFDNVTSSVKRQPLSSPHELRGGRTGSGLRSSLAVRANMERGEGWGVAVLL